MKERISSNRCLLLSLALTSSVAWSLGQARGDSSASNGYSVDRGADIHSGKYNSGSTTAKSNTNGDGPGSDSQGGGCTLAGTWKQTAEGIGSSIWKIDDTGKAKEDGLGFATGTATLTGNRLRLDWKIADAWAGYYEWQLDSGCNSGEGELVFTKGRTGTHKTTVTRQGAAKNEYYEKLLGRTPEGTPDKAPVRQDKPEGPYNDILGRPQGTIEGAAPTLPCTLAGSWQQNVELSPNVPGTSTWEIDETGNAFESVTLLGPSTTGTATVKGKKLQIDWKTSAGGYSGYYEWQLNSDCNSGQGELVFQSGGVGTRKSTVKRLAVTPALMPPAVVSNIAETPDYSPEKLDFGEILFPEFHTQEEVLNWPPKLILRVIPRVSGKIRIEILSFSDGQVIVVPPFRITEVSIYGKLFPPAEQLTVNAVAGQEFKIYVGFDPFSYEWNYGNATVGEKTGTMRLSGGPPYWSINVPLRGVGRRHLPGRRLAK